MRNFFIQQIKEEIKDEFNYPSLGYLYLNTNKQITNISSNLLELIGFSSINDLLIDDIYITFLRNNFKLINKIGNNFYLNKSSNFVHELVRNDSEKIYLNIHMIPNSKKNMVKVIIEDITLLKENENNLEYDLLLQEALTKVSNKLITNSNLNITDITDPIREVLKVSSSYTSIINDQIEEAYSLNIFQDLEQIYKDENIDQKIISTNDKIFDKERFKWWFKTLNDGKSIIVSNIKNFPEAAVSEREYFESIKILSCAAFPLIDKNKKLIGAISFADNKIKLWNSEETRLIRLVAEILTIYIERKISEQKINYQLKYHKNFSEKSSYQEIEEYKINLSKITDLVKEEKLLRRKIESELSKNEEKFNLLTDSIPNLIAYVDKDQKYKFANKNFREWFGLSKEELVGKTIKDIQEENFYLRIQPHLLQALSGEKIEFEVNFSYKNSFNKMTESVNYKKDLITLKIKYIPDMDIDNKVKGIFIIVENLTEKKNVHSELIKNNEFLEISNQELQQFAHIVSHDLKAPLSNISNYLQIIQKWHKNELSEEVNSYIGIALGSVERINIMLKSLLNYSKEGKPNENNQKINFYKVIDETLKILILPITQKKAKINYNLLPTDLYVNKEQIIRLFQNLISNAIKYNNSKIPTVDISAEKKNREWIIGVKDNGIGIDKCNFEYIFEIFHRLHISEKYDGEGIGLAICKKIVESHKGRIWVESTLDLGSTFYFTLPI